MTFGSKKSIRSKSQRSANPGSADVTLSNYIDRDHSTRRAGSRNANSRKSFLDLPIPKALGSQRSLGGPGRGLGGLTKAATEAKNRKNRNFCFREFWSGDPTPPRRRPPATLELVNTRLTVPYMTLRGARRAAAAGGFICLEVGANASPLTQK